MTRYFVPLLAAALAFAAIVAAATTADAGHRKHHRHYGSVAVVVPADQVAAFRRSHIDRHIGPSGDWIDRKRYYYRPYHYWRGPLVYRQTRVRHSHWRRSAPTTFVCRETRRGTVCREPI